MDMTTALAESPLGTYPPDWPVAELASLRPFITSGSRGWARYYADHGAPFIRITNLSRGSIYPDLTDLKLVNLPPEDHEGARTQLHLGDLLVSITADIGIIGYVDDHVPSPSYINQHIALVRCDAARTDTKYLAYFLASERPQRVFRSTTDQGAKAGMSLSGVGRIEAAFPAFAEQRSIATALGDVDALLGALDKLIAKKRDLKQAAMQQLLTGRTRLPGFTGKWQQRRLGDHLAFLKHGTNPRAELTPAGPVKYLHYGDIHGSSSLMLDPSATAMPCLPAPKAVGLDRLMDGDVVFADASEDLNGVGKSVELQHIGETEVVSGMHTIAVRFDKQVLADGFKAYLQFIPTFRDHLRRLAAGTKVYATNRAYIASAELRLPATDEQIAIATVLSDMDAEIAALGARRAKTRDLKQAMMQELLTGRVRLVKPGSPTNTAVVDKP